MAAQATTDRAERSRRAILDAATPVFAERGYSGASLNAIIRASGLTKGGFYFHFPSKLALALAVVDDHQLRWIARVREEAEAHATAEARLFAFPRVLARLAVGGNGPASLRKLVDELARDPKLRRRVSGSVRLWVENAQEQFRDAQAEGVIRADVDPDLVAEVAVAGFLGMQTLADQLGDGELERRIEALVHVVQLAALERPPKGGRDA